MSWFGRLRGEGRVHVSNTSIFARLEDAATQLLVYSMTLSVRSEVAMILPVPTPPSAGEDALSFIDLHEHARFFEDLAFLFEPPVTPQSAGSRAAAASAPRVRRLKVHEVGAFVASFVPTRGDFARLEPRFQLPDGVWDALPDARDFGFAVFQLGAGNHHIHPMAFRFRTRDPGRLFFPTVHIHDGRVHARARFDHALYYQPSRPPQRPAPGAVDDEASILPPWSDYGGVVDRSLPLLRRIMRGRLPNRDTYLAA